MTDTLLQTKLYIPPTRANMVVRSRLLKKLNEGLRQGKLTLASAPAGFGKTTTITAWLAQLDRPVGWVSLDEDDSDAQQFFSYVAAAIRPFPDISHTLPTLLQSPQPAKTLAVALVNDLAALATPCLLILDDYHLVESAEIDLALSFLLDHMPPNLHLVITSRSDPGFPLSRLRARHQLTELRADELRFTKEEAAQFLQQSMNITLSPEQITALENRTEGWVAGLQMAALSMQNREDVTSFIDNFTGSHRFIMDYLLEEVLHQQAADVQEFLLQTAVLTQLCADLCDAVRQLPSTSQQILEQLETHNIFLIPLDNERRWYRYHHLFADLLRQRLQQQHPDTIADLNGRASLWYENNGQEIKAIQHALAAKDTARVADLLELTWPTFDGTFQTAAWLGWANTLPDELVRTRPVLGVAYAWAFLNDGDMEAADAHLCAVEECLQQPSPQIVVVDNAQFQTLPASISSARAYLSQALGDIPDSVRHARRALDLLPADDHLRRGPAVSLLALAHWANGELAAAHDAMAAATTGFEKAGNLYFAISGAYVLADLCITQGRLGDAVQTYEYFLRLAAVGDGEELPGAVHLYLGLAELSHQRGQPQEAATYLQRGEEISERSKRPLRWRRALARIKASQGDYTAALALLDEVEQLYYQSPLPDDRPIAANRARVWIRQGNLRAAKRWADEQGLTADDDLSYLCEYEHITLARLLIAQHQHAGDGDALDDALRLLARLALAAETGGRMGSLIEILALQTLTYQAQDHLPEAMATLERALVLAEPEGYVRLFIDEGEPMAALLGEAAKRGIMPTYVQRLQAGLAGDSEETAVSPPTTRPIPAQPHIDPLSKRELEILTLIAAGLKNKEIAEQLVISLNTVLYHNKNIYSKLGVKKRTLAVTKARELNLIE